MSNHLHIVCLDVPYPPDYGGVFDLFYKLKALQFIGIKIHLHCFEYGRGRQSALNQYCEEVIYYKRNKNLALLFRLPFIVSSRINNKLIHQLQKNDFPILFEGIHCTYYLQSGELAKRPMAVRLHNVEYQYYQYLSLTESSIWKKWWFRWESRKLFQYEQQLASKAPFICVSEKDRQTYETELHAKNTHFRPVFMPMQEIKSKTGSGKYCLYHGNLSVAENEKAAEWLVSEVFEDSIHPLIIAGKNPSRRLINICERNKMVNLVADPTVKEMEGLVTNAHIHLIPSFNHTGIKIKLLQALTQGRFVIANHQTIDGSGLQDLCILADGANEFKEKIKSLFSQEFPQDQIDRRAAVLSSMFDMKKNAVKLSSILNLKIDEHINSPE